MAVGWEMFINGAQYGEEAAMGERVKALMRTQSGYWASFITVYDLGAYPPMGKEQ